MHKNTQIILGIVIFLLVAVPRLAFAQILDSVEVNRANGAAVIWIHFRVPVRYEKHIPSESGQTLQIYVTVSPVGGEVFSGEIERKSLRAKPADPWSLLDVTYDGDGVEGPHVVLRFNKAIQFKVQQGTDQRSIVVLVPAPVAQKGESLGKRIDEDAVQQEDRRYALTLASSLEPFTNFDSFAAGVKGIVPEAKVYSVAATLFGKPVYYARVGFFFTHEEAEAAREKLLAAYPDAWTTPVGELERAGAVGTPEVVPSTPAKELPPRVPRQHTEPAKAPVDLKGKAAARREDAAPAPEPQKKGEPGKTPDRAPQDSTDRGAAARREGSAVPADSPKADQLMADARKALERGDNAEAAKAFNSILALPDNKHTREAQELLGLALERTGQNAMALVEYTLYLKRYVDGDGPERVRQRLAELNAGDKSASRQRTPAPTDEIRKLDQMMADGREALTKGDNQRAIELFDGLLKLPDNKHTRDAQEFLGLVLERTGKTPQALVEYSLYLQRYKEGEGSDRVRLRMANLAPPEVKAVAILRPVKEAAAGELTLNGTLQQDYFFGKSQTDALIKSETGPAVVQPTVSRVDVKSLNTRASLSGRYQSSRYENRFVFDGDAAHSYLTTTQTKPRIGNVYGEIKDKQIDYSARIGRQSGSSGGVLGRFDGGTFGYKLSPRFRLTASAGVPVDTIAPDSERKFAGAGLELGTFAEHWAGSVYLIQQQVDGRVDRRALGVEVRYFHQKGSFFSLLDYDIHHAAPNLFLFQGNLMFEDQTSLNLLVDIRRSPFLLTTSALMGQADTSIAQLVQRTGWSEAHLSERIKAFAPTAKSVSLGGYRPITEKLQIGANFSASNTSATSAIDEYAGSPASGTSLTYSVNLIGSKLLLKEDLAVLSVGRGTGKTFTSTNVGLTVRAPYSSKGYVNASLNWNKQANTGSYTSQSERLTPTLRMDYRLGKDVTIEAEYQKEFSKTDGTWYGDSANRDFYRVGWRWDF
jgi:hypothetical protein